MNRRERRAIQRQQLAALRAHGCRCSPQIILDRTPDPSVSGADWSALVRHDTGCELGDRMLAANIAGRLPMIVVTGTPGCERR